MADALDAHPIRRETAETVLYVAIVLAAAIAAVPSDDLGRADVAGILLGSAIGLALAHWFAFDAAHHLMAAGRLRRGDLAAGAADAAAALAVAAVATAPLLIAPDTAAAATAIGMLGLITAGTAYGVARASGAARRPALLRAAAILLAGALVAVAKTVLGH